MQSMVRAQDKIGKFDSLISLKDAASRRWKNAASMSTRSS